MESLSTTSAVTLSLSTSPPPSPKTIAYIYNVSLFDFGQSLQILLNSTIKQHNATNIQKNTNLQNDIIESLQYVTYLVTGTENDEVAIKIEQIWAYNGSDDKNCQLQNSENEEETQLSQWRYASWMHFNITFIDSNKRDTFQDRAKFIVVPFGSYLSTLHYFVNDTISVSYCQLVTTTENDADGTNLKDFGIIFTICIVSGFICIAICGYIDAIIFRPNEIFSIGAIMSSATYTVDIVSGYIVTICFFA